MAQCGVTQILLLVNLIFVCWVLLIFSKSVNGGIKHILSIEAKSFLQMGKVVDHLHSCVETILVITASDPYLVVTDCLELLDSHRMLDIPQLKYSTDELPYHNAYLRLTNTKIPFYASTNYEKVDLVS